MAVHVRQVTMGLKTISISASQHDTLNASIAWDRPSGVMVAGEMWQLDGGDFPKTLRQTKHLKEWAGKVANQKLQPLF